MSTPTLLPYAERNKPYTHAVYFDGPDGSRKRRKFETRKAALSFLTDKECEYENLGKSIASNVDDSLKRDAHHAQQLLAEFGATLEEAAAHYRKHLLATSRSGPVSTLIAEFLAVKVQNGRSGRHISDLRSRLGEFAKKFGDRFAADIQTEEVETWLLELPGKANATRNHFRSKVHSFFAWCKRKKKCTTNPVTGIDKCDVPPTTCEIYSAAEMRLLLRAVTSWKPLGVRKANAPISQNPEDYRHRTDDVLANLPKSAHKKRCPRPLAQVRAVLG